MKKATLLQEVEAGLESDLGNKSKANTEKSGSIQKETRLFEAIVDRTD